MVKIAWLTFPSIYRRQHKHHITSTAVKSASRFFLTLRQASTSFTGSPQWSELLSRSLLTHKLRKASTVVKTVFKVHPDTHMGLHEFLTTSTAVKTAFWILSNTQTGMNKLHKTSTVVKTCLHELYKTSTVLKKNSFQGPSHRLW